MKKNISILILLLATEFSFSQNDAFQDDYFREKVRLELADNFSKCQHFNADKGVAGINGKNEFWSVCTLQNGNKFITIESYQDEIFFQEFYFIQSGKLRYAKETANYTPKNGFAQMRWNCEFFFENGELKTHTSLGHGKTETDDWSPNSIYKIYKNDCKNLKK